MITEDYVNFETSKLLKEKGFDEPCIYVYLKDSGTDIWDADKEDIECQKPTLQMAMKWLREVHKLYMYTAFAGMEEVWCSRIYNKYKHLKDLDGFSTYEEACEAAIRYCLENLI